MDPLHPEFANAVSQNVLNALDQLEKQTPPDPAFALIFEELRGLIKAGGKRIRPIFMFWGYTAASGSETDIILEVGTALELVHLCALVHDDIMDGSTTRRGRRTPHLAFADAHEKNHWKGNSTHFGTSAAMMAGDLILVLADRLMEHAARDGDGWHRSFTHFTEMRLEVVIGQYLDLVEGYRHLANSNTALEIAKLKTAKYTVERPLLIGAALANSPISLESTLSAFGIPLGIAFQLRDDLLGAFGDEKRTGKPVGIDFREGKQTYLVARLRELGTPAQWKLVDSLLGNPDITEKDMNDMRDIFLTSGAVNDVENRIDTLAEEANNVIESARETIPDHVVDALTTLAQKIAYRDT